MPKQAFFNTTIDFVIAIFLPIPHPLRIHYPLPLEYCGPPDTAVLQSTIRRLEGELERLRCSGTGTGDIRKKMDQLTAANKKLVEENRRLSNGGKSPLCRLKSFG